MVINIIFFWILVVFGVIISLYNWIIVFNCVIKSKNSSCIPLLGGGAIVLAMNLPGIDMEEYESIPLLLDYGCIPLFVHTFFSFIYKMLKGLFKQSKKQLAKRIVFNSFSSRVFAYSRVRIDRGNAGFVRSYIWDPSELEAVRILSMTRREANGMQEKEHLYCVHETMKNVTSLFGEAYMVAVFCTNTSRMAV